MKRLSWLAAFALLVGCGDVDVEGVEDTAAVGQETGQVVIDLRSDDGEAHTIAAGSVGIEGGPQIVRRSGERVSFAEWRDRVLGQHELNLSGDLSEMPFVIIADPDRRMNDEDAMRMAVEQGRRGSRCPPGCVHCPEDYGYLCFSMCGG